MLSIQIGLWPAPQPQIEQRATVEVLREKKKSPRLSESCRARLINYLGAPSIPFLHPIHHPNPQLRNQSHHTRGIPKFPLSKIFFFFFSLQTLPLCQPGVSPGKKGNYVQKICCGPLQSRSWTMTIAIGVCHVRGNVRYWPGLGVFLWCVVVAHRRLVSRA